MVKQRVRRIVFWGPHSYIHYNEKKLQTNVIENQVYEYQ